MARSFFNGTNSDHIDLGNVLALPGAFSLACWCFSMTAGQPSVLLNKQASYRLGTQGNGGRLVLYNGGGGSSGTTGGTTVPSANVWHHAAATYSAAATRGAVYLDGVQDGQNTAMTTAAPANTNILEFGRSSAFGGFGNWSGRIAEVAIWSRELAAREVAALAKGASPQQAAPAGLIGYWPLWAAGAPEADLSGGRHNGTVFGTVAANHAPVGMLVRQPISGPWATRVRSGVNYTQNLSVAQATTPVFQRGVGKALAIVQASAALFVKATARQFAAAQPTLPRIGRGVGKALLVAQPSVSVLAALKSRLVALTANQPVTASLGKGVAKNLSVSQPQD